VRAILLFVLTLVACDPFAPHESQSRTVEGCSDAIKHLHECCPAWDSYLSCTYFANAVAAPDLTPSQSRCLTKMPCDKLVREVEAGSRVCSLSPATTHCRR
jgi:hypothetical protein